MKAFEVASDAQPTMTAHDAVLALEQGYRDTRALSHRLREMGCKQASRATFHAAKSIEGAWRFARTKMLREQPQPWAQCRACGAGDLSFRQEGEGQLPCLWCRACGTEAHHCCELPLTDARLLAYKGLDCICECHALPLP